MLPTSSRSFKGRRYSVAEYLGCAAVSSIGGSPSLVASEGVTFVE